MDANANIQFGLKFIQEKAFSLTNDQTFLNSLTAENLEVQFMAQTFINLENDEVKILVGVKYLSQSTDILQIEMVFTFVIDQITNVVTTDADNKKITFKVDLMSTFLTVAMGTLRGVLFEKTSKSVLTKYPLPLIDCKLLMERNTFHIEKKL
ncbi:MAG: hypothetical protein RSB29_05430 [Alistipes sp.]